MILLGLSPILFKGRELFYLRVSRMLTYVHS